MLLFKLLRVAMITVWAVSVVDQRGHLMEVKLPLGLADLQIIPLISKFLMPQMGATYLHTHLKGILPDPYGHLTAILYYSRQIQTPPWATILR